MKLIELPTHEDRILPFYLALEEWVARNLPPDEYLFAWQVKPSVICGRHQQMHLEVDMDFCAANDIKVWRRKSGGGCVYSDAHNIMFSYITPQTGVSGTFRRYTDMICEMLGAIGFDAKPTGRNDVEINGMKVAGNAFYSLPGRSIVHGTMLYDADFPTMSKALTPSRAKLSAKGVKSVPARVTTLKAQGIELTCDQFIGYALGFLCNEEYTLREADIAGVEEIMQTYLVDSFRLDREPGRKVQPHRVEGVGELQFSCQLSANSTIENPRLSGDFFPLKDIDSELLAHLQGVKADREALMACLRPLNVEQIVAGLTADALATVILESKTNP